MAAVKDSEKGKVESTSDVNSATWSVVLAG